MKNIILLSLLIISIALSSAYADKKDKTQLMKKSRWSEAGGYALPGGPPGPEDSGYPRPYSEFTQYQQPQVAAISTGYYYYDTDERSLDPNKIEDIWRNKKLIPPDTTYQPNLWKRIISGPRIVPRAFWTDNPDGKYFFRNPGDMLTKNIFDPKETGALDTTDNAIAGPIPMGIKGGFFFNGLRYDSLYISINGVISLTNRRYTYGSDGLKAIPTGADHCYDYNSMDWFVGGDVFTNYPSGTRKRRAIDGTLYGDANGDGITDNTGLDDIIRDDFGYRSATLGADPKKFYESPPSDPVYAMDKGIRANGVNRLDQYVGAYAVADCKPAFVAPFWGSLQISQYNKERKEKEDYGKVYFKRVITGDSLILSFFNMTFNGTVGDVTYGSITFGKDPRSQNMSGYLEWDAHIVFTGKDSSVSIIYERLSGTTPAGATCGDIIRNNTTAGVFGWARHVNYNSKNPDQQIKMGNYNYPWAGEYAQYTHYFSKYLFAQYQYPEAGTSVKYKQWKNTLRVANISYRVRNTDPATLSNPSYEFTKLVNAADYEILAGEPLIGAVQPRCLIQNLTNEIQGRNGVNFTPQDFQFWSRFRIRNLVTDRIVYNRAVPVSAFCMSLDNLWDSCYGQDPNIRVRLAKDVVPDATLGYKVNSVFSGAEFITNKYTGVPAYRFVQIDYPPFEPNEFLDNQIGRLRAYIIAEPRNIKTFDPIGDEWPFDDTSSVRLFVMRRLAQFQEDVNQFHIDVESSLRIPSVLKWVTIDGSVVPGSDASQHSLPPRGEYKRHMPGETAPPATASGVDSPCILLNRLLSVGSGEIDAHPAKQVTTEFGNQQLKGDEIRSFPIDLRGKHGAVLSLSVFRGTRAGTELFLDYARAWGDDKMEGPEGKTYVNGDPFKVNAPLGAGITDKIPGNAGTPDMLCVEFAKPSDDGINGICNIEHKFWRHLPFDRGVKKAALDNMPFLTIYGSGGYLRGFLESDPDSVLTYPNDDLRQYNAMRHDLYDDGIDWEFKKYYVQIPDTFFNWHHDGAKNLRFRLHVFAKDHRISVMPPTEPDDADKFHIDNINILYPDEVTDIEMSSVRILWPYTVVPASQAEKIPLVVKLANNTSITAPNSSVKVQIYYSEDYDILKRKAKPNKGPIYCRVANVANLQPGEEVEMFVPSWNARKNQKTLTTQYTAVAMSLMQYEDLIPNNDTTYFEFELSMNQYIAYDPMSSTSIVNGVQTEVGAGKGLSLPGNTATRAITNEERIGPNISQEPYAGKMSMKFVLNNTDTLTGYHAFFGSHNSAPDYIEFDIYEGNDKAPSGKKVKNARMLAQRGKVGNVYAFNQYIPYFLEKPIELPVGTYWLSISQLATDPLALGASGSRTRMKITNYYQNPNNAADWGKEGYNLYVDKNFRIYKNGVWTSDNYFAYLNGMPEDETNKWVQFTPMPGKIAYPHTDHVGTTLLFIRATPTFLNSSWIPMLHPLFTSPGSMTGGNAADVYDICADDVPVELTSFKGYPIANGIELAWETKSEINNKGFEVDRRLLGETEFKQISFVEGRNGVKTQHYNILDRDVVAGETYQYQLKQIDIDGTISCASSNIVTVKYDINGLTALNQNLPNPITNSTSIGYIINNNSNVRIEVIDIYGKVVKVLEDSNIQAGSYSVTWDSKDEFGNAVPSGNYICRMIVGEDTYTIKMTVLR